MYVKAMESEELGDIAPAVPESRGAGQCAMSFDVAALGLLRRDLIVQLGAPGARVVLTRFGFAQGWILAADPADATTVVASTPSPERRALLIEGLFIATPTSAGPLSPEGATLAVSHEADQHIAHHGHSTGPTCWMIAGLLSGYLSRALGRELFVLEQRCIGRHDASCSLRARTRAEWGDEHAAELLFFAPLIAPLDPLPGDAALALEASTSPALIRSHRGDVATLELPDPLGMVAKSDAMRQLVDLARRIAKVDSTVLITGESGTGKERIARFVHDESARAGGPFVAINCGAITESLLESELFGHVRGAFTGAVQHRPGLFEAASGGTLLLDEIGEVSPAIQVKLLRALQEREVRRVGENRNRPTNTRVIAATNRELSSDIIAGRFRKDLYYRLNVVELRVPALRDRREDILPLARLLLSEAALRLGRRATELSSKVANQLLRYPWPGNVRELENAMERAVALARDDRTELEDLPEEMRLRSVVASGDKTLAAVEKDYILAVLQQHDGNQARTAEALGIGTATLYRKLRQYGALRSR